MNTFARVSLLIITLGLSAVLVFGGGKKAEPLKEDSSSRPEPQSTHAPLTLNQQVALGEKIIQVSAPPKEARPEESKAPEAKKATAEPVNIVELYMIMDDYEDSPRLQETYRFRGMLYSNPQLEGAGAFGVYRISVSCCAADAVAASIKLPLKYWPEGGKNNQWVEVTGKLKPVKSSLEHLQSLDNYGDTVKSVLGFYVENEYILEPESLKFLPEQSFDAAYIYEYSDAKPYHY